MKNKNIILLVAITFIAGIIFAGGTFFAAKKAKAFIQKVRQKIEARRIANIPPAKEPLVICNFETPADLSLWQLNNSTMELSNEHATAGKYSAKITIKPSSGAAGVKIEKYFEKNKNLVDWSRYEMIAFDIFNPGTQKERLILQIKDKNESKAKINLYLEPKAVNKIEIDTGQLRNELNADNIGQFNLFLWDNREEKVFYLDNIRLLPAAMFEKENKNILSEEFMPKQGEKIYPTGDYFAFNASTWETFDSQDNSKFVQIPIGFISKVPNNSPNLPFAGGVPFGCGQLFSLDNLVLVDNAGNVIPSQAKILSKWPDKSIKWALLNFRTAASGLLNQKFYLRYYDNLKQQPLDSKLTLQENNDAIVVNTGVLQFSLSKSNFYLFNKIWLDKNEDGKYDEEEVISSAGDLVIKHEGREYHSSLDKNYSLIIEEKGPLKVCLKAKGWFVSDKGDKFCQFVVRISAFEGSSYVKIEHTFIYTGYPENKLHYLYQGKRLPKNETISAIYIKTPFRIEDKSNYTFAADNQVIQGEFLQSVDLLQAESNAYQITKNVNILNTGKKMAGWIDLSSDSEGIALGIQNFWQQFPKGLRIDKEQSCFYTYLWPEKTGELDLKTTQAASGPDSAERGSAFGLAKTHEIFFYFHKNDYKNSNTKEIAAGLSSDLLLMPSAEWISSTKVLGKIWPYDKRLGASEEFLSRLFDWNNRQIENFGWYGMIDFGDTLSWYRQEAYDKSYDDWGWHPEGRWGWFNCEGVGTHAGALIQYLRNGDDKYFRFGANLARHIMDIDTCHYNTVANDKRLKNVIPDAYSQVGSMHRHNGNHWGDRNDETSHTNIYGLALYYYVTGNERAKEVAEEVGSFLLSDRITYFGHADIAPQRSIANALWGDVILYELTADERYKKAADKWANLLYIGQKHDGTWGENYNPVKKRWEGGTHIGYITGYTLPALIAYHQLTSNKAIAECIIKSTDYLMKNEEYVPYFDALAYSYWLTADKKYLEHINNRLDFIVSKQNKSGDPMWDGMIYQKAYYSRVVEFLYRVPFAFEVLADEK